MIPNTISKLTDPDNAIAIHILASSRESIERMLISRRRYPPK